MDFQPGAQWGYRPSQFAPPLVASTAMGRDGTLKQQEFPQAVRTTIHIDSRGRDYDVHPSSSSFVVELPETLKNVSSAVLVSAELPLSYYVFSAARGNTSLTVSLGATTHTVTIPDGNYTTAQMQAALQAALDTAFGSPGVVTATISATTMKCTFSGTGTVSVSTVGAPAAQDTDWGLGWYLGFPKGAVTSGTNAVTGSRVVFTNPENYLLIDVEELNGVSQTALYAAGGSGKRSFAKVTLNGDSYSYNYYDKTLTYVDARPQLAKLDKLRVSIRFHDGTLVDLNGGEWSMSIEFACTLTRGTL